MSVLKVKDEKGLWQNIKTIKGEKGNTGETPNVKIGTVTTLETGQSATATITGTAENPLLNLGLPKGGKGDTGNGISNISKTSTEGLVDTYTIEMTDGTSSDFTVTNGEASQEQVDKIEGMVDDLVNIIPKKTAEGIDNLSYDKALNFNVIDGKINGNVEQETTNGYQLIDWSKLNSSSGGIPKFENDTLTIEPSNNNYSGAFCDVLDMLKNNPGKYLKFGFESFQKSDSSANSSIQITYRTNKNYYLYFSNGLSGEMLLPSEVNDITSASLRIICHNSSEPTTNVITIKKPMLYFEGDGTYEKYTGGQSSPNPEYPQEVETLKAYNLLKIEDGIYYTQATNENYITFENGIGIFTINDDSKAVSIEIPISEIKLSKNTSYTDFNGDISSYPYISLRKDGSYIGTAMAGSDNGIKIYNLENDTITNGIFIYAGANRISNGRKITPMILLGEFKEKSVLFFVPHNNIARKRIGKNLFDKNNYITTNLYYSYGKWLGAETLKSFIFDVSKYQKLTISKISSARFGIAKSVEYPQANKEAILVKDYNNNDTNASIDVTDANYIVVGYYNSNFDTLTQQDILNSMQIEIGSKSTLYEPYQEEIQYIDLDGNELLPDDELDIDLEGNVKLIKKWGKYIFTGDENIEKRILENAPVPYIYIISTNIVNAYVNNNEKDFIFSTHYKQRMNIYSDFKDKSIIKSSAINNYSIIDLQFNKISEFKQWLKENRPIMYYKLETPQIIDLPKAQPTKSLKGTNNVEVIATLEPTRMEETYAHDLQAEVEELKEAMLNLGSINQ